MQDRRALISSMPGGVVVAQRTLAPLTEVRILAGQLHILSLHFRHTCLFKRCEARSAGRGAVAERVCGMVEWVGKWQERQDLNPRHSVLETDALPS